MSTPPGGDATAAIIQAMKDTGLTETELWSPQIEPASAAGRGASAEERQKAREALPSIDRRSMATAELMGTVYWNLLRKLERCRFNVFDRRETRLTKVQKLFLILRMWYRVSRGNLLPNYGVS